MFVCICRGITDKQIREAVDAGACSMTDLTRCLGVASGCGRCGGCAQQILQQTLDESFTVAAPLLQTA